MLGRVPIGTIVGHQLQRLRRAATAIAGLFGSADPHLTSSSRRLSVLAGAALVFVSGWILTGIAPKNLKDQTDYLARVKTVPTHISALRRVPKARPGNHDRSTDIHDSTQRGLLRVLTLHKHTVTGPGLEPDPQHALIRQFALEHDLQIQWSQVSSRSELVTHLKAGHGDVIIDETPVGVDADPSVAATLPLRSTRYLVVVRADRQASVATTVDLLDTRIGVRASSPVWEILQQINNGFPQVQFQAVADHTSSEAMLAQLGGGMFDALIMSAASAYSLLATRPQFAVAFDLTGDRAVAWQVRADNAALRHALNTHLVRNGLLIAEADQYYGDLQAIKQRRVLRVLMAPDRDNFFLRGGARAGFEYELVKDFATQQGLRLELRITEPGRLAGRLKSGRGDLIASRAAIPYVSEDTGLKLSRAYNHLATTVITRAEPAHIMRRPADLLGRRVTLLSGSGYQATVANLRAAGTRISTAPALAAWPDLLDSLTLGTTDAVLLDSHRVKSLVAERPDVRVAFSLNDLREYRWTVRGADRELLEAVNNYLKQAFRSELYNLAYRRYFEHAASAKAALSARAISPYDPLIQHYASRYDFDWRLIAAQMYEESRFDAAAVSIAGAVGLMQVLPTTAGELGFLDLTDPDTSIHAGVQYLAGLRQRLEDQLPVAERTWFALAAYHAGYDRVRGARRIARQLGLDPNRWFDHVEHAMRVQAQPRTDGSVLCLCRQTVAYVREIHSRYLSYVRLAASPPPPIAPGESTDI